MLSILILILFSCLATALQVTPNSPCAQFCLDSPDLDRSDPKSSSTRGKDIVCRDDDFKSKAQGQKFQRCLACLQDSTFKQGSESDQDWFLYNLRYSFDYCVFGFPNATGIDSSPCVTSEACGPLAAALKQGITDPDDRKQYGYCDADGKAMLGDAYAKCYACVKADRTQTIVSNFLVALEAGCQQRPQPGKVVGLNDTVFSETSIQMAEPSASVVPENKTALPNAAIAGIAVGGFVFLLLAAGCIYMQYRKRKNRAARKRRSSLSFRCQAHLSPRSPGFRNLGDDDFSPRYMEENSPSRPSLWNPRNAMSSLRNSHKLASITTTLPHPPAARYSPRQGPDDDITPDSAISTRSNAPLLFNMPEQNGLTPTTPFSSQGFAIASPRSGTLPPRERGARNDPWQQQHTSGSGKEFSKRKTRSWGAVAPVETQSIQIKFDPPPTRPR
ncbi:hypothetical protein ACJ41O_013522 [Fusarium nematophilum]